MKYPNSRINHIWLIINILIGSLGDKEQEIPAPDPASVVWGVRKQISLTWTEIERLEWNGYC